MVGFGMSDFLVKNFGYEPTYFEVKKNGASQFETMIAFTMLHAAHACTRPRHTTCPRGGGHHSATSVVGSAFRSPSSPAPCSGTTGAG